MAEGDEGARPESHQSGPARASDERHEDHGRGARHEAPGGAKRIRLEHVFGSAVALMFTGGISGTNWLSSKVEDASSRLGAKVEALSTKTDAQAKELSTKVEAQSVTQTAALASVQLSLTEIKGQVSASDKAADRLALELARIAHEASEHSKAIERQSVKSEELDRRMTALEREQQKGSK